MFVDTKAKVLLKFGCLQTVCVDRRSKELLKFPLGVYMSYKGLCTLSHTNNFPTLCLYIMKLWIMNVDTKAKVLLKFGCLQTVCVDRRSKMLLKFPLGVYMSYKGLCTLSHTNNFPTLCLYIMKLWIMNVDTKAKVLLKFGSLQTMCVDRRSKELLKFPLGVYMSYKGLCTLSHTNNFPTLCLYIMKLWIMNVDTKAKVLLKFGSLQTMCVDRRSKELLKFPLGVYMSYKGLCTLSHTNNFPTLCLYIMKLWIMNVDTKAKVLSKFGSLQTMCVDRRSEELLKFPLGVYMSYKGLCTLSHTNNFPTLCLYIMKLWIMNVDTKAKVLSKFGSLQTMCVDRRSKKLLKFPLGVYMSYKGLCTLSHPNNFPTLCLYIMKLWIMNVDTKAKVLLKFGCLQTVCVDRRSKKLLKFPLGVYMSYKGLCTLSHTNNFPTLCLYIMKLWIMNVDTKAKVLLKFGSLQTMCVDRRSKKLLKFPLGVYMSYKGLCTLSHTNNFPTLCLYIMKLWIMNVDTKAKVLLKYGCLQTVCVDRRSKKLLKFPLGVYMSYKGLCTLSHTNNFPTLCLYIMKLWIMNVDTKAKVLLKFGCLQTVCVDRRSKKLLKFPLGVYMSYKGLCTLSHTNTDFPTLCLYIMKLWIMNVDTKAKVLLKFGSLQIICVDRRSKNRHIHIQTVTLKSHYYLKL